MQIYFYDDKRKDRIEEWHILSSKFPNDEGDTLSNYNPGVTKPDLASMNLLIAHLTDCEETLWRVQKLPEKWLRHDFLTWLESVFGKEGRVVFYGGKSNISSELAKRGFVSMSRCKKVLIYETSVETNGSNLAPLLDTSIKWSRGFPSWTDIALEWFAGAHASVQLSESAFVEYICKTRAHNDFPFGIFESVKSELEKLPLPILVPEWEAFCLRLKEDPPHVPINEITRMHDALVDRLNYGSPK